MAQQFASNYWGDGGYEAIEGFLDERSDSYNVMYKFMLEFHKHEETYATGLDKLVKKVAVQVAELGTTQEAWKVIVNQLEQTVRVFTERASKIKTDICSPMEIYEKENTKTRKKKLVETKKQIEDYNLLHSELTKSRGKYNKTCQISAENQKAIALLKSTPDKQKQVKEKEKEQLRNEKSVKAAEDAYREALNKLCSFQPGWEKSVRNLYSELQVQEISRVESLVKCFKALSAIYSASENFVAEMDQAITTAVKKINIDQDLSDWIEKSRKATSPPPTPQFHPFNGEPEKPKQPKPHAASIAIRRQSEVPKYTSSGEETSMSSVGSSRLLLMPPPPATPTAPASTPSSTTSSSTTSSGSSPSSPAPTAVSQDFTKVHHGVERRASGVIVGDRQLTQRQARPPMNITMIGPPSSSSPAPASPSTSGPGQDRSVTEQPPTRLPPVPNIPTSPSTGAPPSRPPPTIPPPATPAVVPSLNKTPQKQQQDGDDSSTISSAADEFVPPNSPTSVKDLARGLSSKGINPGGISRGGGPGSPGARSMFGTGPPTAVSSPPPQHNPTTGAPGLANSGSGRGTTAPPFSGRGGTPVTSASPSGTSTPVSADSGAARKAPTSANTPPPFSSSVMAKKDASGLNTSSGPSSQQSSSNNTGGGRNLANIRQSELINMSDSTFFDTLAQSLDSIAGHREEVESAVIEVAVVEQTTYTEGPPAGTNGNNNGQEVDIDNIFEDLGWVRAVFDYEAGDDDELGFQEGEVFKLLAMDDSGWWTGELKGKTGLFPGNHVERVYANYK